MRLRIAVDVLGALSYLHLASSMPIYHQDIKSTNILLDEKYRTKVSDFGTSRTMADDQTHITTQVHGTFGYLDPDFGVVLAELLTGERWIHLTYSEEDKILAAYFLCAMKEGRPFEILDVHVLMEGGKDEIITVTKLAKRCFNPNSKKRPTMTEVVIELAGIRACNGVSNIVQESVEDIDCVDGGIAESSDLDACFTDSSTGSDSVDISMMSIL
ncbi:hypothetical protein AB3S75_003578 [Citrus x aurantiifolia]